MREKIQETIDIIETLPENVHGSAALAELRAWLAELPVPDIDLDELCEGQNVSEKRQKSLQLAIDLGADRKVLEKLRDAVRLRRGDTIVLPPNRLEGLSRGRGWARQGKGPDAVWGDKEDTGYRVGPGRWVVGGTDGFRRKDSTTWDVEHVQVGDQIWTIAD